MGGLPPIGEGWLPYQPAPLIRTLPQPYELHSLRRFGTDIFHDIPFLATMLMPMQVVRRMGDGYHQLVLFPYAYRVGRDVNLSLKSLGAVRTRLPDGAACYVLDAEGLGRLVERVQEVLLRLEMVEKDITELNEGSHSEEMGMEMA